MNIIEVKDLKKSYLVPGHKKKTFNAVDRISLKIRKGEIYVILGPNGAGKTTALRLLSTILRPTSGTATINGQTDTPNTTRLWQTKEGDRRSGLHRINETSNRYL